MSDDLISRRALMRKLSINSKGQTIPEVDCDNFSTNLSIKEVKDLVRNQPTIDVVEVVRCSDCKYGELYMQDQGYMEPPTCEGIICSKHRGLYMDFTDYCSYGKRREK